MHELVHAALQLLASLIIVAALIGFPVAVLISAHGPIRPLPRAPRDDEHERIRAAVDEWSSR